jgi:hypothetical protein
LACQRLRQREPGAGICLVDHDPAKFGLIPEHAAAWTVPATAAVFLTEALESQTPPDWIIPAIPRHVGFEWLVEQLPGSGVWRVIPVPAEVGQGLPYVYQGAGGELYLSLSTERCPDECPEPAGQCYLSGAKRAYNLYDYLENIILPDYTSLVIRSRQLAPGVGGYTPAALRQLQVQVSSLGGKILISTACRCHGVTHGLEKLTGMEAGVGI